MVTIDMVDNIKDLEKIFLAVGTGVMQTLNMEFTYDACEIATKPFRPILKALANTQDMYDGFFETVSLALTAEAGAVVGSGV